MEMPKGLSPLYQEYQRLRKSIAIHEEHIMKFSKEKRKSERRARELMGMIERRLKKKAAREEELEYVSCDIERLEALDRKRKERVA
jgi:CHASE3 domain sensor protein